MIVSLRQWITYCFKMADIVVNFDLLDGLSVARWLEEMDRIEEEGKEERRLAEITERENEELEKSGNKDGTVKQTVWSVF